MAQVVVDSSVMRDKAKTLENAARTIQSLYAEMLMEVTVTANKMKGKTIETEKKQFANMQNTFDVIVERIDSLKYDKSVLDDVRTLLSILFATLLINTGNN